MATISTLAVNLIARTGVFERKMKKSRKSLYQFQKSAHKARQRLRNLFVGAGIGYGASRLVKSLLRAASEAEETQNKFEVVFKNQAAAAERFANDLAASVGRSVHTLKKFMAGLQDIFVPLGFARDKAREMSEAVTKLGIDLASFNDKADEDVLRDLSSALTGMHRTVRKYGIVILQTTLNQELMNMGLEDGVNSATEMQKAQARLNLVLSMSKDAMGDAARTAHTYANQLKRTNAELHNLKVEAGAVLLPFATWLIKGWGGFFGAIRGLSDDSADARIKLQALKITLLEIVGGGGLLGYWAGINLLPIGKQEQKLQDMLNFVASVKAAQEALDKNAKASREASGALADMSAETGALIDKMEAATAEAQKLFKYFGKTPEAQAILVFEERGKGLIGEQRMEYDKTLNILREALGQVKARKEAEEAITKIIKTQESLSKRLATHGMAALEAMRYEIEQQLEAIKKIESIEPVRLQKAIAEAKKLLEIVEKMAEVEAAAESAAKAKAAAESRRMELESFAQGVIAATRTPLEIYEEQIGKLGKALELGRLGKSLEKGGIQWETYKRAVRNAREELERTAGIEIKSFGKSRGEGMVIESPSLVNIAAMSLGAPDPYIGEQQKTNKILLDQNVLLDRIDKGGLM